MATELALARMRRSLRLALIGALCSTALPIMEFFREGRPRVVLVTALCAVIVWAMFFLRRRAFQAVVADPTSTVRSI